MAPFFYAFTGVGLLRRRRAIPKSPTSIKLDGEVVVQPHPVSSGLNSSSTMMGRTGSSGAGGVGSWQSSLRLIKWIFERRAAGPPLTSA